MKVISRLVEVGSLWPYHDSHSYDHRCRKRFGRSEMKFGRMPRPGSPFVLETGRQVVAQRVEVGKPEPGKFVTPVSVWVAGAEDNRQP